MPSLRYSSFMLRTTSSITYLYMDVWKEDEDRMREGRKEDEDRVREERKEDEDEEGG